VLSDAPTCTIISESSGKESKSTDANRRANEESTNISSIEVNNDESQDEKQNQQPPIDFVLYLQQTGSIIALAKLMDALEYGEDLDEGLDDSELQLIREQQMLNQQQATSQ
jgi:hypothetical protein